jgi:hypothetical protein
VNFGKDGIVDGSNREFAGTELQFRSTGILELLGV